MQIDVGPRPDFGSRKLPGRPPRPHAQHETVARGHAASGRNRTSVHQDAIQHREEKHGEPIRILTHREMPYSIHDDRFGTGNPRRRLVGELGSTRSSHTRPSSENTGAAGGIDPRARTPVLRVRSVEVHVALETRRIHSDGSATASPSGNSAGLLWALSGPTPTPRRNLRAGIRVDRATSCRTRGQDDPNLPARLRPGFEPRARLRFAPPHARPIEQPMMTGRSSSSAFTKGHDGGDVETRSSDDSPRSPIQPADSTCRARGDRMRETRNRSVTRGSHIR